MVIRRAWRRVRAWWVRFVQDYRMWHVADRCRPEGCDCPCGYCRHDRKHIPGGVW